MCSHYCKHWSTGGDVEHHGRSQRKCHCPCPKFTTARRRNATMPEHVCQIFLVLRRPPKHSCLHDFRAGLGVRAHRSPIGATDHIDSIPNVGILLCSEFVPMQAVMLHFKDLKSSRAFMTMRFEKAFAANKIACNPTHGLTCTQPSPFTDAPSP